MRIHIFIFLEKREKLNMILYDFSNVFGCLVPEILIQKLRYYGFDEKSLAFISDNEKTSCPTNSSGRVSDTNIHPVRSCRKFNGGAARHGVGTIWIYYI
jgi:hypothetical protein